RAFEAQTEVIRNLADELHLALCGVRATSGNLERSLELLQLESGFDNGPAELHHSDRGDSPAERQECALDAVERLLVLVLEPLQALVRLIELGLVLPGLGLERNDVFSQV